MRILVFIPRDVQSHEGMKLGVENRVLVRSDFYFREMTLASP